MYRVAIAMGAVLVLATTVAVHQTVVSLLQAPDVQAPNPSTTITAKMPSLPNAATRLQPPQAQDGGSSLSFDVVNIDPQGTSVFAGQAPTNSSVVVQANGRVVATTTADETGAWAVATDRKLPAGDYEFTLSTQPPQPGVAPGQSVRMVIAPGLTDAPKKTANVALPQSISMPAPITFVYNETTLTVEGRQAADSLAKQLLAQQPAVVALSGHADERGSDLYNLQLSRRRLTVVADFLRDSGFAGKLELVPKGRSEPYTGIDRNALSQEQAFQLDRRVELIRTH